MCDVDQKASVFVREVYTGNHDGCNYCGRMSHPYRYGWIGGKLSDPVCSVECYVRMNQKPQEVRS